MQLVGTWLAKIQALVSMSPPLFSIQSDSQWSSSTDSPVIPCGKTRVGLPRRWGSWMFTLAPSSLWRYHRLRDNLSVWGCANLGEEQCCQHVALLHNHLIWSAGSLWYRRCFILTSMFLDFYNECLVHE